MSDYIEKKIGDHWSRTFQGFKDQAQKYFWWQSPHIVRHINRRVSGKSVDGLSLGLVSRAKELFSDRIPFTHGVSVGCGNACKELDLIKSVLVHHFTLCEFSRECIAQGIQLAKESNLEDRIRFVLGNAFQVIDTPNHFDLVHWNNSLHHMLDVELAVQWSHRVLKKGRLFYMDDFVGPNRFQWSDKMLEIASLVRKTLPKKYLRLNTKWYHKIIRRIDFLRKHKLRYSVDVFRPNIDEVIQKDPSEAADSKNILPMIRKYFPESDIVFTGGVIYHLSLTGLLQNFDEMKDRDLLDLLLTIDDLCAETGETLYATALALRT